MIHQDMVISPRLSLRGSDDVYRIVLTWGRQPKDLDSYLITPWPRAPDCESGMVSVTLQFPLVSLESLNQEMLLKTAKNYVVQRLLK